MAQPSSATKHPGTDSPKRFDLDRVVLLSLAVGAVLLVYLVSTGVILSIAYEPQPEEAIGAGPAIDPPFLRWSHRWAANALVIVAIVATPVAMIASLVRYRPAIAGAVTGVLFLTCLLYTSPSPRDQRGSRMPSSA